MEAIAFFAGFGLLIQVAVWVIAGLLFPLFWVWMLVDAVLRADAEYPGAGPNTKVIWVLLLVFVQLAALFYFFMVYRQVPRNHMVPAPRHAQPVAPSAPPSAA